MSEQNDTGANSEQDPTEINDNLGSRDAIANNNNVGNFIPTDHSLASSLTPFLKKLESRRLYRLAVMQRPLNFRRHPFFLKNLKMRRNLKRSRVTISK
jgi:hypothetical protein